ncbi:DNA cytosine methyltransferase [Sinorhizobium medicae]|nr:DNA cytosine methyltransferase [Sinorhizobium medicae]
MGVETPTSNRARRSRLLLGYARLLFGVVEPVVSGFLFSCDLTGLQESLEPLGLLFHWYAFCVHLSREVNVPRIRRNIFYSGVRPPLIHTPFHISRFL